MHWLRFLEERNFRTTIPAPEDEPFDLECTGDAAGTEGFGGFCPGVAEFFHAEWPAEWRNDTRSDRNRVLTAQVYGTPVYESLSSALQEAATIATSVALYAPRIPGRRLRVNTDSHSAFLAFKKGREWVGRLCIKK